MRVCITIIAQNKNKQTNTIHSCLCQDRAERMIQLSLKHQILRWYQCIGCLLHIAEPDREIHLLYNHHNFHLKSSHTHRMQNTDPHSSNSSILRQHSNQYYYFLVGYSCVQLQMLKNESVKTMPHVLRRCFHISKLKTQIVPGN